MKKNDNDVHNRIILQGAEIILRNLKRSYSQFSRNGKLRRSYSDYNYLFVVPTRWNDDIQEDLLRPLYIRAGLIQNQDHPDRLLFFSQLDFDFCYLQYLEDDMPTYSMNTKIGNGKHYILYAFNFSDTILSVTLDLFSAHYSPVLTTKGKYVPRVLNSVYFTVPLSNDVQEGYIDSERIDQLSNANKRSEDEWEQSESVGSVDNDGSIDTQESIDTDDPSLNTYGLVNSEEFFTSPLMSIIQNRLLREVRNLTDYKVGTEYTAIVIGNEGQYEEEKYVLFDSVSHWIKKTSENLFGTKLMTFGLDARLYYKVTYLETLEGGERVLNKYVQKSNSTRPPSIITENIKSHAALSASLFKHSKPNCIINIGTLKYKYILLTNKSDFMFVKTDVLSKEITFNCAVLKSSGETEMLTDHNEW
ncbi:hypothetical protein INT47_006656 [Mucor saturninus]|uniref:Uncharacterized protein n=1 Tax=Mucor saturninus TaxID=64648 RepID=A0A8H7QEP8_9FUNG|nr:hypothetical protein INT47_006656 [Mucor saturninus]